MSTNGEVAQILREIRDIQAVSAREQAAFAREAAADRERAAEYQQQAAADRKQFAEYHKQADADRKQFAEYHKQAAADRKQFAEYRKQAAADRRVMLAAMREAALDRKQAERDRKTLEQLTKGVIRVGSEIIDRLDRVEQTLGQLVLIFKSGRNGRDNGRKPRRR